MNIFRIKTADLVGAQLDWAVAKAMKPGTKPEIIGSSCFRPGYKLPFCPSKNWQHGGPIIDRERISLSPSIRLIQGDAGYWIANMREAAGVESGPTPLIAAMRAFVASKLGGEVEVPAIANQEG